ncbi:MAG: hypothetical protein U0M21_00550 [Emergencia sp.]|nr:hypothetical protein [Emergencia sp.]
MSNKTDKAIAKITEEAMAINNTFAIFIEEHLTGICTNDKVADKLLVGKPLKEFCKRCEDEAREEARKQGNGVQLNGLPDAEYQRMVEEYYGITDADKGRAGGVVDIMDYL